MTELLVSTKKGLFALSGEPGGDWEIVARAFAGEPIDYAVRDPRTRRVLATMTSPFYGPKVFYTERSAGDWGVGTRQEAWECAEGVALPAAGVWHTDDAGRSWRRGNQGLPPRYVPDEVIAELNLPEPSPDADTALCVHHLERAPARPERMFIQFHGGVYRSDDAGSSWSEI